MPKSRIFSIKSRAIIEPLVEIIFTNPFLENRQRLNQQILGDTYTHPTPRQTLPDGAVGQSDNQIAMVQSCRELVDHARKKIIAQSITPEHPDYSLYEHLIYFLIYHDISQTLDRFILKCIENPNTNTEWKEFTELKAYYNFYLKPEGKNFPTLYSPSELSAFLFQIRRAFFNTQTTLAGSSPSIRQLRARIWDSIFTHNMRRYLRSLYHRMNDIYTLITGPSGSGKEIIARCIALSRFIPFDPHTKTFERNFMAAFFPVNLSALSPTLIESELFGHRRGAFTGALQDRAGYSESSGRYGTIFLDEIGDTDPKIQVKLLRVLQSREFQQLGNTKTLNFQGKVMAATNIDLVQAISKGHFREDLYYRLCADKIETPFLKDILSEIPGEIDTLVRFIALNIAGTEEVDELTEDTLKYIQEKLPHNYSWPGNFRELEQCVRNIMIHGNYLPHRIRNDTFIAISQSQQAFTDGAYSLNELLKTYVTQEYNRTPNMAEVGMRLKVDPRTIKKYLH
ncbi:MAG: sigma-54-dependent Fis family transcriptional regulator [Opitutaceae bacterium]|nr:sigma-54-dependent Fis family transcriptional regulator [Opitutaceae bacterium]